MISRGMDIAAKGMMSLIDAQDVLAHNLANVNTTGYKKEALTFKSVYNAMLSESQTPNDYKYRNAEDIGRISMGSDTHKLVHEFMQGTITKTGVPLDLAIQGDGFFKVRDMEGNISYTRNGSFMINSQNLLVDSEGSYVLDNQNQPIQLNIRALGITTPKDLTITQDGQISIVREEGNGNTMLQRIGLWDFSNKEDMVSLGKAKYIPKDIEMNPELPAEKFVIEQGALELSNTNVVNEMINSINVSRNYETLSKFIKEKASHLSAAINIGRLKG